MGFNEDELESDWDERIVEAETEVENIRSKQEAELIEEEGLVENSNKQGTYFLEELKKIESPVLKEIRGKGLWIGVEINTKIIDGRSICKLLLKKGILSKETHESTIRFAPPLIIEKKEIDWAVQTFKDTLKEIEQSLNR